VVKEGEPEAMKEVKFLLEIKPLIDIGAMYVDNNETEELYKNLWQFIIHGIFFLCLCFYSQVNMQ
jgi:hypothetical protein